MIIILLSILILSYSILLCKSSYEKVVVLTVIGEEDNQLHSTEYGKFKSQFLKYLSIDNRLRYCVESGSVVCVIGIGKPNNKSKRNKLQTSFKSSDNHDKLKRTKRTYNIFSSRYLKVIWILKLLTLNVKHIFYLDADAFITKSFDASSLLLDSSSACLGLTHDAGKYSNRFNTGMMLIRNCGQTVALFNQLMEIHQRQRDSEANSDQLVFNSIIQNSNNSIIIQNISRIYNSNPIMDEPLWSLLGLQQGDESSDSCIVHFAGIWGGGRLRDGGNDVVINLLTMKGAVIRHRQMISQTHSSVYYMDNKISMVILDDIIKLLNECIAKVYSGNDNLIAENLSVQCLKNATILSKELLTSMTINELKKNGLLIVSPSN